jgi:hypothetical protein
LVLQATLAVRRVNRKTPGSKLFKLILKVRHFGQGFSLPYEMDAQCIRSQNRRYAPALTAPYEWQPLRSIGRTAHSQSVLLFEHSLGSGKQAEECFDPLLFRSKNGQNNIPIGCYVAYKGQDRKGNT